MTVEQRLLRGWAGGPPTRADVVTVTDDDDARPHRAPSRGCLPRGLGRSYGDAAQNAGGLVYDLTGLTGVRRFDTRRGLVTVAAGTSIAQLLRVVVPQGWFPAVTPGTRWVTVGGAIAADVHGKNHARDGGFCRHVRTFVLATPTGERRTVTAHHDPEVFWATAGGMGLTGVVTEATLQLTPIQTTVMRVQIERTADLDDTLARLHACDDRYAAAWLDLADSRRGGRGILSSGDHARVDDLPSTTPGGVLQAPSASRWSAPARFPSGMIRPSLVRGFNELYYRAAPERPRQRLESLAGFLYPLDAVRDWNRLYGSRGFLQYQIVVPFGAEDVVRTVAERFSAGPATPALAVLKRLGSRGGPLSFPLPGWTLSVDLPLRGHRVPRNRDEPELASLLDELDRRVLQAGGRVYLAKDARLRREVFHAMYPRWADWRAVQARLDPGGRMRSDLGRRLELLA